MIDIVVKSQSFFAAYHINSSKLLVEHAVSIEQAISENNDLKNSLAKDYISYVSASVIMTVSALEANINELLISFREHYISGAISNFSNIENGKYISDILAVNDRIFIDIYSAKKPETIERYKRLSMYKTGTNVISGVELQFLKFIFEIRNNLAHHKSYFDNEVNETKDIEKWYYNQYKNAFPLSVIFHSDLSFFPYKILSASCAKWCFDSSCQFMENYKNSIMGN